MKKIRELIGLWRQTAFECPRDYQLEERALERCADELEALLPELEAARCCVEACTGAADPQPGELAKLRAVADLARRAAYANTVAELSGLLLELRPLLDPSAPKEAPHD